MNPWKVSAQFAAFVWYSNQQARQETSTAEAAQFAKENWIAFLPYAHEGYGRLLIKIARPAPARGQRNRAGMPREPGKLSRTDPAMAG